MQILNHLNYLLNIDEHIKFNAQVFAHLLPKKQKNKKTFYWDFFIAMGEEKGDNLHIKYFPSVNLFPQTSTNMLSTLKIV